MYKLSSQGFVDDQGQLTRSISGLTNFSLYMHLGQKVLCAASGMAKNLEWDLRVSVFCVCWNASAARFGRAYFS